MDLLFNMEIYAVSCVPYEIKFCHLPLFSFQVWMWSTHCHRAPIQDR